MAATDRKTLILYTTNHRQDALQLSNEFGTDTWEAVLIRDEANIYSIVKNYIDSGTLGWVRPVGDDGFKSKVHKVCDRLKVDVVLSDSGVGTSLVTDEMSSGVELVHGNLTSEALDISATKQDELMQSLKKTEDIIQKQSEQIGNEGLPEIYQNLYESLDLLSQYMKSNPDQDHKTVIVRYFLELIEKVQKMFEEKGRHTIEVESMARVGYPECGFLVGESKRQDEELKQLRPKAKEVTSLLTTLGAAAATATEDTRSLDGIKALGLLISNMLHELDARDAT